MFKRKPFVESFAEAQSYGPYDELPILPAQTDPQIHVSKNTKPQPFYLICEKDSMLVQLTGSSTVLLKHPQVISCPMQNGDFLYIPAGTPHRIVPAREGIFHRYKAKDAGLEGVAWYCEDCNNEVAREVWDCVEELPQHAYLRITRLFNATEDMRRCPACGKIHAPVDISDIRWERIAADINASSVAI